VTIGVGSNVDAPIPNPHYPPLQQAIVFGQSFDVNRILSISFYIYFNC
jgi:hypothetical protein